MCEHHGAAANSRPLGRVPALLSFFRSLPHRQNEILRYFFRSGPMSVFVQKDKVDRKYVTGLSSLKLDVKKSDLDSRRSLSRTYVQLNIIHEWARCVGETLTRNLNPLSYKMYSSKIFNVFSIFIPFRLHIVFGSH